jgi:hypothetical protein
MDRGEERVAETETQSLQDSERTGIVETQGLSAGAELSPQQEGGIEMNGKNLRKLMLTGAAAITLLVAFGLLHGPSAPANANTVLPLHPPPFVSIANAEPALARTSIESEAGISAYFKTAASISLSDVRDAFRTIEVETADYIIGSVPVANYPESEDVHVYVHKDGWILAYYLAADPAAKTIDWRKYHDSSRTNFTTKLESTIAVMASEAGFAFNYNATYYDFRYPNATHLMLIGEWVYDNYYGYGATDSFEVKLPSSLTYYERSWSLGRWVESTSSGAATDIAQYKLDGATIKSYTGMPPVLVWQTTQGTLTVAQLLPDQFHTIEVRAQGHPGYWNGAYAYGGLALVYKVP